MAEPKIPAWAFAYAAGYGHVPAQFEETVSEDGTERRLLIVTRPAPRNDNGRAIARVQIKRAPRPPLCSHGLRHCNVCNPGERRVCIAHGAPVDTCEACRG